ncbi:Probable RNA-directed DNA polymerase from transposon BS [Eumeta japonica]|uniref:Probable RNA-directed DNA polymerase from transposon BS n=1 Tax=Eumeta variegata TaxID=151549 RepID=A0A4C1VXK2_EUMVA|nr:Probable RNA-directed DNA polymerase from transposon BS [Eumeta japonica]
MRLGSLIADCPPSTKTITNWQKVSAALEEIDTPILNNIPNDIVSTDDIDNAIGALTNHIRTVVESSSRTVPAKSGCRVPPRDAIELIKDKNAALRRAGKYPTCENRSRARALQRKVKARMKEVRNENWSDLMSEISPSHKSYWGLAKALKTEGAVPTPALKRPDIQSPYDLEHVRRVEEEVRHRVTLPPKDDLEPITQDEISKHIKGLKIRKAPGRDTITHSKALKCSSAPLVALLVAIFNACIQNCYFPTAWKEAVVMGIPKSGKPRDLPASYRPISLLSVLDKLFEKTLKTRLSDQLIGKDLIINEQFGFRPHHSCPQQALRLVEHILEGFKVKRKTVAVFFDVAKAFDRTRQYVLVNETYQAGVPQGSTLSPLLYSAYINDIPRPSTGVQLALLADDTALYLRSNSIGNILPRLQRAIDELTQWLRLWRIDVNPDKLAAIYFNYSSRKEQFPVPLDTPHLRILNQPIPWQHHKYLGITIDKHLHFRGHIARVKKLALFYLSRLYGMIGRKSKMSLRNKRTTYTMCIRPVMIYASPVFAHARPDRLYELQKVQNKFCKRAADAPWYVKNSTLHRDIELPTISKFMKDASERFFDVASNHPDPLLVEAVSYEPPPPHHFCRRPRSVLIDPPDDLTIEVEKLIELNKMVTD